MTKQQFEAQMAVLLAKFPFQGEQEPAQQGYTQRVWAKVNSWKGRLEEGFVRAVEELVDKSYGRPSVDRIVALSKTKAGYGGEREDPSEDQQRENRILELCAFIRDRYFNDDRTVPTMGELKWWANQRDHHLLREAFACIFRSEITCSNCLTNRALLLENPPGGPWFWECLHCAHRFTRPAKEWGTFIEIEQGEHVDRPHPKLSDLVDLDKAVPF